MHTQTLYRTVRGMMQYERALELLLATQRPDLSAEQRSELVAAKFQCVVAMQRYHAFAPHMREGAHALLAEFPRLAIAYIEELPEEGGGTAYYSVLIDGTCPVTPDGGREPRQRVRLPGHPILGDGKGDNQNVALPFVRGRLVQTIDANQEGYLEEALKICNALGEFGLAEAAAALDEAAEDERARAPPGEAAREQRVHIVGFKEHVYSGLGSVAEFAAASEFVFGSMIQRTMDWPLLSRQYYGHPDIMDKLTMMAQGGVSKATKGLNLSEDVFAGFDLTLRGGRVVHREYMQLGKGREMSFASQMKFISKLSRGAGEVTLTRQSFRLGTRLPLPRMLGVYYAHVGFYLNPLLQEAAVGCLVATLLYHALSDAALRGADGLPEPPPDASRAAIGGALVDAQFGPLVLLFVMAQALPLFAESALSRGVWFAARRLALQLATGSWAFFSFQTQLQGHAFRRELESGGAAYIATGRGFGVERQPFAELYRSFGVPCMLPGAALGAMAALALASRPEVVVNPQPGFWAFVGLVCFSWVYSPFVFNPRHLSLQAIWSEDVRGWARWVLEPGKEGWRRWRAGGYAEARRRSVRSALCPGRRTLALVAFLTLLPHAWSPLSAGARGAQPGWQPAALAPELAGAAELVLLATPVAQLLLVGVLGPALRALPDGRPRDGRFVLLAALAAAVHTALALAHRACGGVAPAAASLRARAACAPAAPAPLTAREVGQGGLVLVVMALGVSACCELLAWAVPHDEPPTKRAAAIVAAAAAAAASTGPRAGPAPSGSGASAHGGGAEWDDSARTTPAIVLTPAETPPAQPARARGVPAALARAARAHAHATVRDTLASYALLTDTLMLLLVVLPSALLACVPGVRYAHTLLIMRALPFEWQESDGGAVFASQADGITQPRKRSLTVFNERRTSVSAVVPFLVPTHRPAPQPVASPSAADPGSARQPSSSSGRTTRFGMLGGAWAPPRSDRQRSGRQSVPEHDPVLLNALPDFVLALRESPEDDVEVDEEAAS